jgi:FemAB-related protein (PEP-CTERM system-associated)
VKIRRLDEVGTDAWNELVEAAPEGTFFHLAEWESVVVRSFGFRSHYIAAADDSGVIGVLPLFVVKRPLLGTALMSTPVCVVGGAVALSTEAATFLEAAAIAQAKKLNVDYLEIRDANRRLDGWHQHEQFWTFTLPILDTEEANLKAIPRRQRAVVRKAIKLGLTASVDRNIDPFYSLYAQSMHRVGTPAYPKTYMQALLTHFGERTEIITVNKERRPLCSMLCFRYKNQTLPYYAGATAEAYASFAYTFTFWSAVKRGLELGYEMADFGRSIQGTGSFAFKKNWGMDYQPLHYQTYLVRGRQHPSMDPASLKFRAFSATWKRLPRFLVDRLSPFASRLVV